MAVQQETRGWNVDFVICLDATKSMAPIINEVKANAMSFYQRCYDEMTEVGRSVDQLRVKVIAFRDYGYDAEPMVESEFFTLPAQNEQLKNFMDTIEAKGGKEAVSFNNNEPSNALEAIALALALKSDWTTGGSRRRHVIFVFSDAPALPLGERADSPSYPSGLPKNLAELGAWWEGTDRTPGSTYQKYAGRLIVFVPNAEPWVDLQTWNNYWSVFSTAGTRLADVDIQNANSIIWGNY